MRSTALLSFLFFHASIVSYGLPQLSSSNISPRDSILIPRQACVCQLTTSCSSCTGTCCPANTVCVGVVRANYDQCCVGSCSASSPPPATTDTSAPDTATSTAPGATGTTTDPTTTGTTNNPTTQPVPQPPPTDTNVPPPKSSNKTGAIAGGAVGGAAVVGAAGFAAWLGAKNGAYTLGSLASALFGLFLFRSRRLIFNVDADIGPTQISMFLTPHKKLSDTKAEDPQKILVWKVFDVGHSKRQFEVTVPCTYREGALKLGFGTIEDEGTRIKCVNFAPGPAYLDNEGNWNPEDEETMTGKSKRPTLARNDSEKASRLAVGTLDETESGMDPFLLLENSEFENGSEYRATGDLYLHVFRSVGYTTGKYKDTIVKDIEGDRLSPIDGIRVKSLRPVINVA